MWLIKEPVEGCNGCCIPSLPLFFVSCYSCIFMLFRRKCKLYYFLLEVRLYMLSFYFGNLRVILILALMLLIIGSCTSLASVNNLI